MCLLTCNLADWNRQALEREPAAPRSGSTALRNANRKGRRITPTPLVCSGDEGA
jgi:hypothetical protein